jgi:hypothetical protein
LQGFLLQIDKTEVVAHEADDPNPFVNLFDSQTLAGGDGRHVDALAMHADSPAGGDEDVAVMAGIGEARKHVPNNTGHRSTDRQIP